MERQIGRRIGCPSLAGDIVQDIFLRLWERATSWRGEPAAYLNRCARNASIDHLRAEHARARVMAEAALRSEAMSVPSGEDVLAAREELGRIDAALLKLPTRTRHIFLLNRVHGRKQTEIAAVFGISERAVTKHISRAIEACARLQG